MSMRYKRFDDLLNSSDDTLKQRIIEGSKLALKLVFSGHKTKDIDLVLSPDGYRLVDNKKQPRHALRIRKSERLAKKNVRRSSRLRKDPEDINRFASTQTLGSPRRRKRTCRRKKPPSEPVGSANIETEGVVVDDEIVTQVELANVSQAVGMEIESVRRLRKRKNSRSKQPRAEPPVGSPNVYTEVIMDNETIPRVEADANIEPVSNLEIETSGIPKSTEPDDVIVEDDDVNAEDDDIFVANDEAEIITHVEEAANLERADILETETSGIPPATIVVGDNEVIPEVADLEIETSVVSAARATNLVDDVIIPHVEHATNVQASNLEIQPLGRQKKMKICRKLPTSKPPTEPVIRHAEEVGNVEPAAILEIQTSAIQTSVIGEDTEIIPNVVRDPSAEQATNSEIGSSVISAARAPNEETEKVSLDDEIIPNVEQAEHAASFDIETSRMPAAVIEVDHKIIPDVAQTEIFTTTAYEDVHVEDHDIEGFTTVETMAPNVVEQVVIPDVAQTETLTTTAYEDVLVEDHDNEGFTTVETMAADVVEQVDITNLETETFTYAAGYKNVDVEHHEVDGSTTVQESTEVDFAVNVRIPDIASIGRVDVVNFTLKAQAIAEMTRPFIILQSVIASLNARFLLPLNYDNWGYRSSNGSFALLKTVNGQVLFNHLLNPNFIIEAGVQEEFSTPLSYFLNHLAGGDSSKEKVCNGINFILDASQCKKALVAVELVEATNTLYNIQTKQKGTK